MEHIITMDELPSSFKTMIQWVTKHAKVRKNLSSVFLTNGLIRLVWNSHTEEVRIVGNGAFPHIEHELESGEFAVRLVHNPNESGRGMSMVDNGKFLETLSALPGKSGDSITNTLIVNPSKSGTDAFSDELVKYDTTDGDKGLKRSKALWHYTDMSMTVPVDELGLVFFEDEFNNISFDVAEVDGDGYIRRSFANKLLENAGENSIEAMKHTDVLSNVIIALPDSSVAKGHLLVIDDEAFDRIAPDANVIMNEENHKYDFGLAGGEVAVFTAKPYAQFKAARTGGQWEAIFHRILNKPYLNGDTLLEYAINEELGMAMARTAMGKPAWTPRSTDQELEKAGDEISLYTQLGLIMEDAFGSTLPAVHVTQHSARRELENMSPFYKDKGKAKAVRNGFDPLSSDMLTADSSLGFRLPATKLASIRSDAYLRLFHPNRKVHATKAVIDHRRGVVLGKDIITDALWAMGKGDLDDVAKWTRAKFTSDFEFRGVTITPEDEVLLAHRTPSNCVIGTHRETGETGVVGHEYYIVRLDMNDAETARRIKSFGKPVTVNPDDIPVNILDIDTDAMLTEAPTDGDRNYWAGLEYIEENPGVFGSYSIAMTALATMLELHYGGRVPEGIKFESTMVTEYAIDSWTNVVVEGIQKTDDENKRVRKLIEALANDLGSIDAFTALRLGWLRSEGRIKFPSMGIDDVPVSFPLAVDSPTNRVVKQFEATNTLREFTNEFMEVYLGVMKGMWHNSSAHDDVVDFGRRLNLFYRATPGGREDKARVAGTHLIDKDAPEYSNIKLPFIGEPENAYMAFLAQTTNPRNNSRILGGKLYPISNMMFSVTAAPFVVERLSEYEEAYDYTIMGHIFDALKEHFFGAQLDKMVASLDTHMIVFIERMFATLRIPMQGTLNHVRQDLMSQHWHNVAPVSETLSSDGGTVLNVEVSDSDALSAFRSEPSQPTATTLDEEGNVVQALTLDDIV